MASSRLPSNFFQRDALEVAPELLGKTLVLKLGDNSIKKFKITEVEAYCGTEEQNVLDAEYCYRQGK